VSVRTVLGVLADRDGLAQRREQLRTRSWSFSSLEYRDRQDRVPVRLNHGGPRIGRLEHLELDRQDRLIAVASVDADIIAAGHDWFFSSGMKYRGDAYSRSPRPTSATRSRSTNWRSLGNRRASRFSLLRSLTVTSATPGSGSAGAVSASDANCSSAPLSQPGMVGS
jgi:hypothetical protein